MSVDDLKAFFEKLESDPGLQERARALAAGEVGERAAGLSALAAEQGLEVTAEDLAAAAADPAVAALDDESLRTVVGGISCLVGLLSATSPSQGGTPVG